jgi:hypothetical protein
LNSSLIAVDEKECVCNCGVVDSAIFVVDENGVVDEDGVANLKVGMGRNVEDELKYDDVEGVVDFGDVREDVDVE